MARQIIQSGPSEFTLRQQAFREGLNDMSGGLSDLVSLQKTQRQEALQQRELANQDLNQAIKLTQLSGQQVLPEDLESMRSGSMVEELAPGEMGPPQQSRLGKLFEGISTKSSEEAEFKRQQRKNQEEDRQLRNKKVEAEISKLQRPDKADNKARQDAEKDLRERTVTGLGEIRTKKEAQELRQAQSDANDATGLIDQIKQLGDGVTVFDRKKIKQINQLKTVLAGKLRLPLTGPGAMTEDEFKRLIDTLGDPSNLLSTEGIENAKLDQLKDILQNSVNSKFASTKVPDSNVNSTAFAVDQKTNRPVLKKSFQDMSDEELDQLEKFEMMRRGVAVGR